MTVLIVPLLLGTFSIVAADPATGQIGVAVQSKFPAVGALVPAARAGVGGVATQALANVAWKDDALRLLAEGLRPAGGGAAARSGRPPGCRPAARPRRREGSRRPRSPASAASITRAASPATAMPCRATCSPGAPSSRRWPRRTRLRATRGARSPSGSSLALEAGQRAGGDRRGQESAAILVVKPGGGYGGTGDVWMDLRVTITTSARLPSCGGSTRTFTSTTSARRRRRCPLVVARSPARCARRSRAPRFLKAPPADAWDEASQRALEDFMGWENLEGRIRRDGTDRRARAGAPAAGRARAAKRWRAARASTPFPAPTTDPRCGIAPSTPAFQLPRASLDAGPRRGGGRMDGVFGRRRFLKGAALVGRGRRAGVVPAAADAERLAPRAERVTFGVPGLDPAHDGLRVAQLSDLHVGPRTPRQVVRAAIDEANALRARPRRAHRRLPVTSEARASETCASSLGGLAAPTVAVLGNHDVWVDPAGAAARCAATATRCSRTSGPPSASAGRRSRRRRRRSRARGARTSAARVQGLPAGVSPARARPRRPGPPSALAALDRPALCLSGHTHGGQINIPILTPLLLAAFVPEPLHAAAGSQLGQVQLYVNRGIGMSGIRVRVNAPPEVTLATLRRPLMPGVAPLRSPLRSAARPPAPR